MAYAAHYSCTTVAERKPCIAYAAHFSWRYLKDNKIAATITQGIRTVTELQRDSRIESPYPCRWQNCGQEKTCLSDHFINHSTTVTSPLASHPIPILRKYSLLTTTFQPANCFICVTFAPPFSPRHGVHHSTYRGSQLVRLAGINSLTPAPVPATATAASTA